MISNESRWNSVNKQEFYIYGRNDSKIFMKKWKTIIQNTIFDKLK